jgi:3-oxoacyl-[acyl-carrier-protein] synthase II
MRERAPIAAVADDAVVITGIGAVSPLGVGARTAHRRWLAGASGIVEGRGRCRDFDARQFLTRKELRRTDRFAQLAIGACSEALTEARLLPGDSHDPHRVACVIGTSMGGAATFKANADIAREQGLQAVSPLLVPMAMGNAAVVALALRYGIKGPCMAINAACASGAEALAQGFRLILDDSVDAALVGGAEAFTTDLGYASTVKMGVVSPSGVSRPFDRRRDGLVHGEGAGAVVLERAGGARARTAPILGQMLATASTCDAFHISAPDPSGDGAARAIEVALARAGVRPGEVHYVNAHGTATVLNDRGETAALKRALGPAAYSTPVSSLKSAIGHTVGAAGAIEAIATLLAIRGGIAPPTLNLSEPDAELDLNYVPNTPQPLRTDGTEARIVGFSNSFGLGGHNAVVVLAAIPVPNVDGIAA